MKTTARILLLASLARGCLSGAAPSPTPAPARGDRLLEEYFRIETARLAARCLADIRTLDDWKAQRERYRAQLQEMLGLSPWPERTELKPVITGRIEHEEFIVEKLHFQSRPGLYVTANLYLPKNLAKPAPVILYVCGHSRQVKDGVSFGNKTGYQHHGAWFARNGYVCLAIDTLQLGEIEGIHHGTYRYNMWWWNSRGYTSAGVEAWNSIRALDYLATRPEADMSRVGVTGRSGGGAYSWFAAALDDRIKVAAPVAGITDLQNHVADGVARGHCDCMYFVNTYGWDYPQLAALVAPRPLLICNTDKDRIFPLDGVVRVHAQVARIYELNKASDKLGLLITEGPHRDTQDLQVPVFRWFNRFLKNDDSQVELTAVKFFDPPRLKVFDRLPADAVNTNIQETFVPPFAPPEVPANAAEWSRQRDAWLAALREKTFGGWPADAGPVDWKSAFRSDTDGVRLAASDFSGPGQLPLRLYLLEAEPSRPDRIELHLLDAAGWDAWLGQMRHAFEKPLRQEIEAAGGARWDPAGFGKWKAKARRGDVTIAFLAPRGVGLTAWSTSGRAEIETRRRFMLLGQTVAGMQVWDVRRGLETLRALRGADRPVALHAGGDLAVVALYAALFEPGVATLELTALPASHRAGPDLLNVLRFLDVPHAAAMAAERASVRLVGTDAAAFDFARQTARQLGWPKDRLVIESGATQ
jgi:dienelactone hydrolase